MPDSKRNIQKHADKEVKHLMVLLDKSQASEFKKMVPELQDTWMKKQMFRTETEMRFSVLSDNKYPTKAAKYWISKGTTGISGYEFHHHLNTLLNRIDKMSMAHSVEVRTPYLDYELAEFGLKQNVDNLFRFSNDNTTKRKIPLMKIYEKLFHVDVSGRNKIGFRVPFDEWAQNKPELRRFCAEILSETKQFNELNHNRIEELRQNLVNNDILDNYQIRTVWLLTNYLLWRQNTCENNYE